MSGQAILLRHAVAQFHQLGALFDAGHFRGRPAVLPEPVVRCKCQITLAAAHVHETQFRFRQLDEMRENLHELLDLPLLVRLRLQRAQPAGVPSNQALLRPVVGRGRRRFMPGTPHQQPTRAVFPLGCQLRREQMRAAEILFHVLANPRERFGRREVFRHVAIGIAVDELQPVAVLDSDRADKYVFQRLVPAAVRSEREFY